METKKNKKYDLERKRPLFFGIGMIISLSLALFAFEWKSEIEPIIIPQEPEDVDWYVLPDPVVTKHDIPKPPEPIKEEKPVVNQASIIEEVTEELYESKEVEVVDQGEIDIEPTALVEVKEEVPDEPFLFVEEMPSFPGGDLALLQHISKHLRYPQRAQRIGVQGKVFVTFIINEEGEVSNVEVVKGIGAGCDEEAKRIIEASPKWIPGKQQGKLVRQKMLQKLVFKL